LDATVASGAKISLSELKALPSEFPDLLLLTQPKNNNNKNSEGIL
jgi:hypothetical protein